MVTKSIAGGGGMFFTYSMTVQSHDGVYCLHLFT
jgi:hypothetical protein